MKVAEKIKTHILSSIPFFEIRAVYESARRATDDNMAHAHCMLDT
jgi:hypothetical protein